MLANRRFLLGGTTGVGLVAVAFFWGPLLVELHLHRARRALHVRNHEEALDEARTALRLGPKQAEPCFLLARAYRRMGQLDKVPPLLRQARKLGGSPERAEREIWLLAAQAGHLREAEPHLPDLLMDPRDDGADICEAYVQGYVANFRSADTLQLLDVWQKEYQQDPEVCFMRGHVLETLVRYRESVAAYREGLKLAPHRTIMRYQLANVLMVLREFDEADELLRRCAAEDPENPDILTAWANCRFVRGDVDRARQLLDGLLDAAPNHFEARQLLGQIELSQGRFEEAVGHLEFAVGQRPYSVTIHNALARALQALGRTDEAQPHLDYVAEAKQPLDRMRRNMRMLGDHPHDAELRYQIGAALLKYGSPDDAANWLLSVLQFEPDHQGAHEALTAYYEARGGWKNAVYHRKRRGQNR